MAATTLRRGEKVTTRSTPACGGFPEVPGRAVEIVGPARDLPAGWYEVKVRHPVLGDGRVCVHESTFAEA